MNKSNQVLIFSWKFLKEAIGTPLRDYKIVHCAMLGSCENKHPDRDAERATLHTREPPAEGAGIHIGD